MRLSDARAIAELWKEAPPEAEMLAILAQVYTSWRPGGKELTEAEQQRRHRASLEARWNAGSAMNVKQLFEAMNGAGGMAMRSDGTLQQAEAIRDFPGTVH